MRCFDSGWENGGVVGRWSLIQKTFVRATRRLGEGSLYIAYRTITVHSENKTSTCNASHWPFESLRPGAPWVLPDVFNDLGRVGVQQTSDHKSNSRLYCLKLACRKFFLQSTKGFRRECGSLDAPTGLYIAYDFFLPREIEK